MPRTRGRPSRTTSCEDTHPVVVGVVQLDVQPIAEVADNRQPLAAARMSDDFRRGRGIAADVGVVVTDVLLAETTFVSATPSQGSCSGTTTVSCAIGTLANPGSATITLVPTTASTPGQVSNTATVTAPSSDPNSANNSSTSTITTVNPSSIPAMSQWVLIAMIGMLAMFEAMKTRS